ncbi:MAG: hypothetical protein ACJ78Q_14340, partial [Chloroflexia bacterium]
MMTIADESPEDVARPQSLAGAQPGVRRSALTGNLHLWVLPAHLVLAIFFTWPLALNLMPGAGSLVPGYMQEDIDQNLWNLWWVRQAVLGGHNPFVTDMIWYPTPVSLYYHTLNVFNGLLAIPLLQFFSLTTVYNIIVLFSFVVGGYGAYLVVRYLCNNRWAAIVGSVVFTYSAYHIATMRGLLQLISLEWFPFFVLFLLLAVNQPAWRSRGDVGSWLLRRALPAGAALLLVSLIDWYYTMYGLMFAGFFATYLLVRGAFSKPNDGRWTMDDSSPRTGSPGTMVHGPSSILRSAGEPVARVALCIAVYAVLVSPILVPTLRELGTTTYMQPAPDEAIKNSADLARFFQTPRFQQIWARYFTNW